MTQLNIERQAIGDADAEVPNNLRECDVLQGLQKLDNSDTFHELPQYTKQSMATELDVWQC